jgi:hypothetical protein
VGEEIVTYELQQDKQGRLRASAVNSCAAPGGSVSLPIWGGPLAAGVTSSLGAATVASKMHPLLLAFYAAISITAFIAYALDKSAAAMATGASPRTRCICWPCSAAGRGRCWRNTACA